MLAISIHWGIFCTQKLENRFLFLLTYLPMSISFYEAGLKGDLYSRSRLISSHP